MTEPEFDWQISTVAEDELSKRQTLTAEIETMAQLKAAALQSQQDTFWPMIEALADVCDAKLAELGFPGAIEMVAHNGAGKWWRMTLADGEALRAQGHGFKLTLGANLAKACGDLSDAWYAGEIGLQCRQALEEQKISDAGDPYLLKRIYEIASLRTDWHWRKEFKPPILTGRKIRKVNDTRREWQNANSKKAMQQRRESIMQIVAQTKLKGGALEQHIQTKLGDSSVSPRTIRRDLAARSSPNAKKLGHAS